MRIKKVVIILLYLATVIAFAYYGKENQAKNEITDVSIILVRKTDDKKREFNASTEFYNTIVLSVNNGCSSAIDSMIGKLEIKRNNKVIFSNDYLKLPLNGLKPGDKTEISLSIKTETMAGEGQSELWTASISDLDILFYCKEMNLINHKAVIGDPTVIRIKYGSSGNNNNQSSSNSTSSNNSSGQDSSLSPIIIDHIKTHIIDRAGVLDNSFINKIGKEYFDFYEASGIQLYFAIENGPVDEDTYLSRLLENAWGGIAVVYDLEEETITYMEQNTNISKAELDIILDEICNATTYEDMVRCLLTETKKYA